MKKTSIAVLVVSLAASSLSMTSHAKEKIEKPSPNAASIKSVSDFIAKSKQKISGCEEKYDAFLAMSFAKRKAWESEYNYRQAMARANGNSVEAPKMESVEPYHKVCAESAKQEMLPAAKPFIKSFKSAGAQKNAKDMVAQWITAIDAIGNDGAKTEIAKFETLSNGLMLDF